METYRWAPEETLSRAWAEIVELLEARSKRLERQRDDQPVTRGGEPVQYDNNPAAFGFGRG